MLLESFFSTKNKKLLSDYNYKLFKAKIKNINCLFEY